MAFTYSMTSRDGRNITFDYPEQLTEAEAQKVADDILFEHDMERLQAEAKLRRKSEDYGILSSPTDYAQDVLLSGMQAVGAAPRIAGQVATALGSEDFGPELLKDTEEYQKRIESMKSEGYQARQAQNALEMAQAEGGWDKFLTAAGQTVSPVMLSQELIKMAPELAATGAAGRLASGLGAGSKVATGAAIGTGASLQAGDVLGDVYQTAYDGEVAKGTPHEKAVSIALSTARSRGAEMFGVSLATMMLPGGRTLEKALAGTSTGRGLVSGAVKGFLGEAAQEAIEETTGQYLKNLTTQTYDPSFDPTTGLAQTAGQAAVLGGVLGGPAGGISGARNAQIEAVKQQLADQQAVDQEAQAAADAQAEQLATVGTSVPVEGQLPLPGFEVAGDLAGPPQIGAGAGIPVQEAPDTTTPAEAGQLPLDLDLRSDQERLAALQDQLKNFDENYPKDQFKPRERGEIRRGIEKEMAAINKRILAKGSETLQQRQDAERAQQAAEESPFNEAQPDLFGEIVPPKEPTAEAAPETAATVPETQGALDFGPPALNRGDLELGGLPSKDTALYKKYEDELSGLFLGRQADRARIGEIAANLENMPQKWASNLASYLNGRLQVTENLAATDPAALAAEQKAARDKAQAQADLEQLVTEGVEAGVTQQEAVAPEIAYQENIRIRESLGLPVPPPFELAADNFVAEQVGPQVPQDLQVQAADLLNQYDNALNNLRDTELAAKINARGQQLIGNKPWGQLKGNLSKLRSAKAKALRDQLDGIAPESGQMDMFAEQERKAANRRRFEDRAVADLEVENTLVDATAKERAKLIKALQKTLEAERAKRAAAEEEADRATKEAKDAKSAVSETEVPRRVRRDDNVPGSERSVEVVESTGETEPTTTEAPTPPESGGMGDTTGVTGGDTGGAEREPTALTEEAPKRKTLTEQGNELELTGRPLGEIEEDVYSTEGNEQNQYVIEYVKTQTGRGPTPAQFKEVKDAAANLDELPKYEPAEEVEAAPAPKTPIPKSLEMFAEGVDSSAKFDRIIDQAIEDGYFSKEEAGTVKRLFAEGTVLAEVKAKEALISRARDTEYFRNNPQRITNWLDFLRGQYEAEIAAVKKDDMNDFLRSNYGETTPLSTVAGLEKKFAPLIKKLRTYNKINIVQNVSDLPSDLNAPSNVKGAYYRGEIYVVAHNNSELTFEETVAHELVGHLGLEQILGKTSFMNLLRQVNGAKNTNPRVRRVLENIKRAYTNEQGEYNLDEIQEAREILAHIAQEKAAYFTDNPIKRIYNTIANKVRQFLARLGFVNPGDALLDQLIYDAAMYVKGGKHATQSLRQFQRVGFPSYDLMQRAWAAGYRGFDTDAAAQHLKNLATTTEVEKRTSDDILNGDLTGNALNEVAFSRAAPANLDNIDPKYHQFNKERPQPKTLFEAIRSVLTGQNLQKLNILMVDSASNFNQKMMRQFNNDVIATENGSVIINPAVSQMQAQRSSSYANMFMRTGWLQVGGTNKEGRDMTGLWNTEPPAGTTPNTIVKMFDHIKALGDRIGDPQIASNMASDVFIARRELEIHERNEALIREAEKLEAKGGKQNKTLAKKKREAVVDIFLKRDDDGRTVSMSDAEIETRLAENRAKVREFWDTHQELRDAYAEYDGVRKYLVELGVEHGLFTKDAAEEWLAVSAYVPFNRLSEDMDGNPAAQADIAAGGSGLMNIENMKRLRGSANEVNNVLDNIVGQSMWMTSSIIRAESGRTMFKALDKMGQIEQVFNDENEIFGDRQGLITFYEDGKKRWARPTDALDAYAWRGAEHVAMPAILTIFKKLADYMRKGITWSPEFIISQLSQDSFRAMQMAGLKHPERAAAMVVKNFNSIRKDLQKGGLGAEEINRYGQIGMYDSTADQTREEIEYSILPDNMSKAQKLQRWAEINAEASDLALRKAVYDQTIAEGGSEQLAVWRAAEIINFSRRGSSSVASLMRQTIPFFGAWTQGQNVLWKTVFGKGLAQADRKTAYKILAASTAKVMALSMIMAAAMGDDDNYQNQPDYIRHRYMMLPSPFHDGYLKLAMPPDLALVTKMIPEMIVAEAYGYSKDSEQFQREAMNAIKTALMSPNVAAPQAYKPFLEAMTNYNFYQSAPLVGLAESSLAPEMQVRTDTSLLARGISQTLGVSAIKADHILRSMFGTLGQDFLVTMDIIGEKAFGKERSNRELAQLPVIRSIVTKDQGTASLTNFYALREKKSEAVNTVNKLMREGRGEELREYLSDDENRKALGMKTTINKINNEINKLRRKEQLIEASPSLSGAEKRERIKRLSEARNRLAAQAKRMRSILYD